MKKNISSYAPFFHENFQFKKNVIDLARKQPSTFEGIHTATLLYVNAVDYIALHLLENLKYMTYLVTNNELNGTIFFNNIEKYEAPLGKTIYELKKYEFPDKNDFMSGLEQFVKIRNKLVHNLLSLKSEEIDKINDDFNTIKELGEALLNKYDLMVKGMTSAWYSYTNKLTSFSKPANTTKKTDQSIQEEIINTKSLKQTKKSRKK